MTNASFRPHIEGLRALAISLVLLFHAGLPLKGGFVGVDIFFVISGFLITGVLLRELEARGDVSLLAFYARRAKRLLPASCLVLCFAAVGVWSFAPESKRVEFGWDIASASVYAANLRFAERSVDYLAEDLGRSPVLHFWSLAVEEQFYFIWPVLLLLAARLARRTGWHTKGCASALLLLVFVPSLIWSVIHTNSNPSVAFFATSTRLWELGLGGLLALAAPLVERLPKRFAQPLAISGWVLVGVSPFLFGAQSPWPGAGALLPTTGTALLIASGSVDPETPLLRPLTSRPAVLLGNLSYSIYLWHWPFIVIGIDFFELQGWVAGLGLVALSFVPAYASHQWVENKFRFSPILAARPAFALTLGLNFSLIALVAGLLFPLRADDGAQSWRDRVTLRVSKGDVTAQPAKLGAGVLAKASPNKAKGWPKLPIEDVIPNPAQGREDVPNAPEICGTATEDKENPWCTFGDPHGKVDVVVVGDSKIQQYYEALDAAGKALGWKMRMATRASCPFSAATTERKGKEYKECRKFVDDLFTSFERNPPDLLISSQLNARGRLGNKGRYTVEGMAKGLAQYWSRLEKRGTQVVVVLDNPYPAPSKRSLYDCIDKNPKDYNKCTFSLKQGFESSGAPAQLAAAKLFKKVNVVDLTQYFCPQGTCRPVIGGVLVNRNISHITNTYAKTLAPVLTRELKKAAHKANPKLAGKRH